MFIKEVLRMHPIAIQAVHRRCMENTKIGNYFIEKGF
jgi:cytochrome P450